MPEAHATAPIIRFGIYEADLKLCELRKSGRLVPLQQRPFEILSILLESADEVVTREEFRRRLWPANSFLDFDRSLNVSVNKLRSALGDSADNPRFVATVGRRGYRFIAPVCAGIEASKASIHADAAASAESSTAITPEAAPVSPTATTSVAPQVATPTALVDAAGRDQDRHRRFAARYLIAAVAVVLALALTALLPSRLHSGVPLTDKDFVLVADFVNTTGEPVFDGSLRQGVSVKLAESPFFNLVQDAAVRDTLGLMARPADARLVPPIDREVCQRQGAKLVIGGSIVAVGSQYVVNVNAVDCFGGRSVAREEFSAGSPDGVLSALGRVLPTLRRRLGETLASIQKFDTPIEAATTRSLAALKAYTDGDEKRAAGKENEAVTSYKLAIELDPDFAIAYARVAAIYRNSQELALASDYQKAAYERRDHISARERLYIAAGYYLGVTHETLAAIQTFQLWRQLYPRDWIPANNLANEEVAVGRLSDAIEAAQAALRLNPHHALPYSNLAGAFKRSSRYAEAKAICERAIAQKHDGVEIHSILYEIAFAENDSAAMQRQLDWAKGRPREADLINRQAWGVMSEGRVAEARALFLKAREVLLAQDLKEYAASVALDEAEFEAALGNGEEARGAVATAEGLATLPPRDQADVGIALAVSGATARAEVIAKQLRQQFPLDTLLVNVKLAEIDAALAMNHNDPAAAVAALRPAIPFDLGSPPDFATMYYRGVAYLKLGFGEEARAQMQHILNYQGISPHSPFVALAELGEGRALTLLGDLAAARRAYAQFFGRWHAADANTPILMQARAEYAHLAAPAPDHIPSPK